VLISIRIPLFEVFFTLDFNLISFIINENIPTKVSLLMKTLCYFDRLYQVFLELYGEQRTFFLDEIQNVPGWERFVRRIYFADSSVM